jgi:hypothetical protein
MPPPHPLFRLLLQPYLHLRLHKSVLRRAHKLIRRRQRSHHMMHVLRRTFLDLSQTATSLITYTMKVPTKVVHSRFRQRHLHTIAASHASQIVSARALPFRTAELNASCSKIVPELVGRSLPRLDSMFPSLRELRMEISSCRMVIAGICMTVVSANSWISINVLCRFLLSITIQCSINSLALGLRVS